ncbi:hypothetical protein Tco_0862025 [Tanacetum coccineum]
MANLEFCDKHNMVAYLKKPSGSEGFQEIYIFQWLSYKLIGKEFTITKASVRRHLQLADVDGISVLPTTKIFAQLSLMGYVSTDDKLTFQKAERGKGPETVPAEPQPPPFYSLSTSEPIPNVPDEAVYEEWDDKVERATTTATSLDAEHTSGNINRTQSMAMPNVPLSQGIGAGGSPRCQKAIRGSIAQTSSERVPIHPYDSPLPRVNTLGSDEACKTLLEFDSFYIQHCPMKVYELETDLKQTKSIWCHLINKLIKRRRRAVSTGSGGISTAKESVSTAGASMPVSTAGMVQEVNISIPSPVIVKDKGKGKMEESEDEQSMRTKLQQEQERLGHEATLRLQEELDEEERHRMARVHEAAQSFTQEEWENIRARVEADEELSRRLQDRWSERGEIAVSGWLCVYLAGKWSWTRAKRLDSETCAVLECLTASAILDWEYSFDELKELFETTMKNVNAFIPMETEDREGASELAAVSSQATITDSVEVGCSKRAAEVELDHEGSKKQKTNEASGLVQEQPEKDEKELSQENLQQMMIVVLVEEVYVEALQVKYTIIN